VSDSDWFAEWFGEEYLALYPHRDDAEAREVAELIAGRVRGSLPESGARALDLACGAGRHQRTLSECCWWTVGLDLSPSLLRVARERDRRAPLVRADMRVLPFANGSFALVANLFTSFGYFQEDQQHARVLTEIARVTAPNGWFVLDFLHEAHVRRTLVPRDVRRVGGHTVEQEREITTDGRFVRKTITVGEMGRTFVERVRLFTPQDLVALTTHAGFEVQELLGDYHGRPLASDSPRVILFARRGAP